MVLLLAILFVPLAMHAFLGTFSRYVADDYCTAAITRKLGFWGSQDYWYTNWTGRYAYNGTLALLDLAGPGVVPVLPAAAILGWTAALAWMLRGAVPLAALDAFPRRAFLPTALSALVVGLTVAATPDVYQSVYWRTGLVNYTVPLVLLTLQVGILARSAATEAPIQGPAQPGTALLLMLLAFTSAAYSETYLLAQSLGYAAAVVWLVFVRRSKRPRPGWVVAVLGLLATAIAAGLVLLAPGNAVRMSLMPERMGISAVVFQSFRYAASFSAKTLLRTPAAYLWAGLLAAGLGAIWGRRVGWEAVVLDRRVVRKVLMGGLGGALLVVSLMIPSAYATAAYPVDRALIGPTYLSAMGGLAAAIFAGVLLTTRTKESGSRILRRAPLPMVLVLAAVFAAVGTSDALAKAGDARDYALQWDRRESVVEAAKTQGLRRLVVNPLPHIANLPEIEDNPTNWVNLCFAQVHGFDSVIAR